MVQSVESTKSLKYNWSKVCKEKETGMKSVQSRHQRGCGEEEQIGGKTVDQV